MTKNEVVCRHIHKVRIKPDIGLALNNGANIAQQTRITNNPINAGWQVLAKGSDRCLIAQIDAEIMDIFMLNAIFGLALCRQNRGAGIDQSLNNGTP